MNEAYPLPNLLEFAFLFDRLLCLSICQLPPRKFYTLAVLYFIPYLHAV